MNKENENSLNLDDVNKGKLTQLKNMFVEKKVTVLFKKIKLDNNEENQKEEKDEIIKIEKELKEIEKEIRKEIEKEIRKEIEKEIKEEQEKTKEIEKEIRKEAEEKIKQIQKETKEIEKEIKEIQKETKEEQEKTKEIEKERKQIQKERKQIQKELKEEQERIKEEQEKTKEAEKLKEIEEKRKQIQKELKEEQERIKKIKSQVGFLSWGIPTLISTSNHRIHYCSIYHKKCNAIPTKFKINKFKSKIFENNISRIWRCGSKIQENCYSSSRQIKDLVFIHIVDIISALNLDLRIVNYVAIHQLAHDTLILFENKIPVGVIEVKQPEENVLENKFILGKMYDHLKILSNFYGVSNPFGIITTLEEWRICWLHEKDLMINNNNNNKNDDMNEKSINNMNNISLPGTIPSKTCIHKTIVECKTDINDGDDDKDDNIERSIHVSKIFTTSDDEKQNMEYLSAIATVLTKMSKVKIIKYKSHFDCIEKREFIVFSKEEEEEEEEKRSWNDERTPKFYWKKLNKSKFKPNWNLYPNTKTTKSLYAIEDLGYGADGRVWLTCTRTGAICVLKFGGYAELLNEEYINWCKVYGDKFNVVFNKWNGSCAIQMPHFSWIEENERESYLPKVKQTLIKYFHKNKLKHNDIAWRNIGLHVDKNGDCEVIVYDLHSLSVCESDDWIDDAIEKLKLKIGGEK